MVDYIPIKDVLEGKVDLPDGLVRNDIGIFLESDRITDREKLYGFMIRVIGPIPPSEQYFNLQVGNYLVATKIVDGDPLFRGSIIKIGPYKTLLEHVDGTGVIRDHPSTEGFSGWNLDSLISEIRIGAWEIMDEEQVKVHASNRGLVLNLNN